MYEKKYESIEVYCLMSGHLRWHEVLPSLVIITLINEHWQEELINNRSRITETIKAWKSYKGGMINVR